MVEAGKRRRSGSEKRQLTEALKLSLLPVEHQVLADKAAQAGYRSIQSLIREQFVSPLLASADQHVPRQGVADQSPERNGAGGHVGGGRHRQDSADPASAMLRSLLNIPGLSAQQRRSVEAIGRGLKIEWGRLGMSESPGPESAAKYQQAVVRAVARACEVVVGETRR